MQIYKGMRVFPPHEYKQLERIVSTWIRRAKAYGFQQYKTPVLDPIDLYTGKTSEEILEEQTYRFTDRGGREVLLRPEITPGVSAMIVDMQQNHSFHVPCKVFSVGSVFRYEREQKGRKREHIQYNVDIFGVSALWADAEIIEVAFGVLTDLGFSAEDFEVRLNDRQALISNLKNLGVTEEILPKTLRLLDRREKMEEGVFSEEFKTLTHLDFETFNRTLTTEPADVRAVIDLLPDHISAHYHPGTIRGFDYYTGVIFEIFSKDTAVASRSVAAGGRYDKLIEQYGGKPLPAVGFGMGDVVLADFLHTDTDTKANCSLILCATDDTMLNQTRLLGSLLRKHFPVSFIGTVSEKKLSDVYKRSEQQGILHVLSVFPDHAMQLRILSERETRTFTDAQSVITFLSESV